MSQIIQGSEATHWLREYLNCGVDLLSLAFIEGHRIRLQFSKLHKNAGEQDYFDEADVSFLRACFSKINLEKSNLGSVLRAEFEENVKKQLTLIFPEGLVIIEFEHVQLQNKKQYVYLFDRVSGKFL